MTRLSPQRQLSLQGLRAHVHPQSALARTYQHARMGLYRQHQLQRIDRAISVRATYFMMKEIFELFGYAELDLPEAVRTIVHKHADSHVLWHIPNGYATVVYVQDDPLDIDVKHEFGFFTDQEWESDSRYGRTWLDKTFPDQKKALPSWIRYARWSKEVSIQSADNPLRDKNYPTDDRDYHDNAYSYNARYFFPATPQGELVAQYSDMGYDRHTAYRMALRDIREMAEMARDLTEETMQYRYQNRLEMYQFTLFDMEGNARDDIAGVVDTTDFDNEIQQAIASMLQGWDVF